MNAAKRLARSEAVLESGVVERVVAETIEVRSEGSMYRARRAKSCLVAPQAGDTVLCGFLANETYVLAVLDGREGAPTKLSTDGDLQIQSRGGRVVVGASQGVDLISGGSVSIVGTEIHARAPKGSVAIDELGYVGKLVQAQVTKVTLLAQEIDSIATRLSQKAKRVFRFIEEIDQTRAGAVDIRAQRMLGLRAENAVISARVLAKLDGEQIHIG